MKSIKSKITIGTIFLFALILLVSVLGIIFMNQLAHKSKGTITDNYSSIDYTTYMLSSLEELHASYIKLFQEKTPDKAEYENIKYSKEIFENNLRLETNNITEKGESELVIKLQGLYEDYLNKCQQLESTLTKPDRESFHNNYLAVRKVVLDIYKLNMSAITLKSKNLQNTADSVIIYMSIVAMASVLITLFFIFAFPSIIVEPIKELTDKIKSISEKKYDQKLAINTNDELGELASAFNIMADKLKQYEAKQIDQLLFEQKRLEAVVHSFEDGLLFINENQKVVLINDTILQIIGLEEKDILQKYIPDVSETNDLLRDIYKYVLEKNSDNSREIKPIRITREGKDSFFNLETEEIITYSESTKKQTFIGNLILLRNITKFQERDTAKTNLLATASHELKTPLSSINLSLKLLEDNRLGGLNNEQKEVVKTLRQQSVRLSRVINELLDFTQIETGNIKLKFAPVKPDVVLDIGVTALMMQISEKSIILQTDVEDGLPLINVDLEKMVFVFINLLNNALRYSKNEDEIYIGVKRVKDNIEFSIKDNGPGISKDDRDKLFQRFTQVGNKSKHGWGLGLAISKEFIDAQNGKIHVESEIGKGSKFVFSVPCFIG